MPREEKKYMVKEIADRLKKSPNVFVAAFKGLAATDMDILREKLEEVDGSYLVVKNTLAKRALKDAKLEKLNDLIDDTSSFALGDDDPVKSAKALVNFAKEHEGFNIRGGYVSGQIVLENEVKRLASLPSRDVLLAQVARGIRAPIFGLAFVLGGLLGGFVRVLGQVQEKLALETKEEPQPTQEQKVIEENKEEIKEKTKEETAE